MKEGNRVRDGVRVNVYFEFRKWIVSSAPLHYTYDTLIIFGLSDPFDLRFYEH